MAIHADRSFSGHRTSGVRRPAFRRVLLAAVAGAFLFAAADRADAQQPPPPAGRPKIGLVLSGGGAMGIAHIGVIQELERLGIRPDVVVGTSMGSIVGGMYASGMNGQELEQAVVSMDWDAIFDTTPPRNGLTYRQKQQEAEFPVKPTFGVENGVPQAPGGVVSDANLILQLRRLLGARDAVPSFDQLPIPFRAVATDIETGNKVVLDRGELAGAMRASMSVPGVFAPYHINGKLLVDGGMADNVPVDVARAMGADIVIVVATQTALAKADEIHSAPEVLGQTATLLILANERVQLATVKPTDVLITVDTEGLTSGDFKKGKALIAAGRKSALKQEEGLKRVAALGTFQTAVSVSPPPPRIDYVRVENHSRLSDQTISHYLDDFVGKPLNTEAIVQSLQRIRALGGFSRVDFRIEKGDAGTGLILTVDQRPSDIRRLRPGITIAATDGGTTLDVSAEYRMMQLDANGSEARFVATIGERLEFTAEYFKLLDRQQRWFVEPQVQLLRRPITVYNETGYRLGQYDAATWQGALSAGRQIGTFGELRGGILAGGGKASLQEGEIVPRDIHVDTGQLFAIGGVDTLDNPYFPNKGFRGRLQYTAGLSDLGQTDDFQEVHGSAIVSYGFGANNLTFSAEAGDKVQGILPVTSLYTLGGPFNFPGYQIEELSGDSYVAGRLMYRRKLTNHSETLFGLPIYAGATLVAGNTWTHRNIDFSDLRWGANVFIAADTLIGPAFLVFGAAEHGRTAAYLFIGKPF